MKRSQKKLEKLKKNFDRRRELYHLMKQYGDDIMRSDNFKSTRNYVQHGTIPVRRHCLDVAQSGNQPEAEDSLSGKGSGTGGIAA